MIPKEYINVDGIVTVWPNSSNIPGEGNGLLQTGLAVACEMYPDTKRLGPILDLCRKSPECPLIWRSPYKHNADDNESVDDYWGCLPFSQEWAKQIRTWGLAHNGNYDVHEGGWTLSSWFTRYPAFTPFLKHCAGEPLNFYDRICLSSAIFWNGIFVSHADSNMAAFCRIKRLEKETGLITVASSWWFKRIRAKYGSVGQSWAAYFGAGHPLNNYDKS